LFSLAFFSYGMRVQNRGLLATAALLVLIDQCTKMWVKGFTVFGVHHTGMYVGESFPVLGEFIRITFVENPGMAFGIEFGAGKILLSLFSILMTVGMVWYLGTTDIRHRWARLGLMLVLAGAAGNLIDRVFYGALYGESPLMYGKVVDFIDVDIIDIVLFGERLQRFWIFNVADSCVSVGIILLFFVGHHLPFFHRIVVHDELSIIPEEETSASFGTLTELSDDMIMQDVLPGDDTREYLLDSNSSESNSSESNSSESNSSESNSSESNSSESNSSESNSSESNSSESNSSESNSSESNSSESNSSDDS
jgi:signal peptidase II